MFRLARRRTLGIGALLTSLGLCISTIRTSEAEEPFQGNKSLEQWRVTLKSEDVSLRWQAAEALGQMGHQHPRVVVRALNQAMKDDDLDVRLQTVAGLVSLKQYAEPAVGSLGIALQDKDSDLRRQAALALAGVGPSAEETVSLLGLTLKDPNANVRLAALSALQAIGPDSARATDDLLGSLKDKVPSVRRASATAIATIIPQAEPGRIEKAVKALAAALQDSDPEVRRRSALALGTIGARAESSVAALGEASRAPQSPIRHEAASALGRIGAKAIPELTRNLEHADPTVRAFGAEGLQLMGYRAKPAFGALCKLLLDKDQFVWQRTAATLRATDPEPHDILPILKQSLAADNDISRRAWAVQWLAEIGLGIDKPHTKEAVALLTAALADDGAGVRSQAAFALGNIGAEATSAIKALQGKVGDPDGNVRLQAAIALGKIDPRAAREAIPVLLQALTVKAPRYGGEGFNKEVANALAAIGAVEPLLEALGKTDDEAVRAGVTFALVRMGPRAKGAFKHLQSALQNREASVRQRSAYAMQAILPDPKEAVPVLVESLKHEDDVIRRWAATFLGELGARAADPVVADALEPLVNALKKEAASDVRTHSIRALGEIVAHLREVPKPAIEQDVVKALTARLTDINADVRHEATAALGKIGAARKGQGAIREAIPALLEALTKGRPFQADAAIALGQIGQTAPLVEALQKSKSEKVRAGVAHALEIIGPEASEEVPALVKALKDDDCHVRHQATLALGAIGRLAATSVPDLLPLLEDADPIVPPAVAYTLERFGPEADTAVGALGKALSSTTPGLRQQAQAALVAIGPAAVHVLRELLKSKDDQTVILAAQALHRIGSKTRAAIPDLVLTFAHNNPSVKHTIAEVLALFGARTPEAIPALALAVSNGDIRVATAAVTLLQELKADTPAARVALIARLEQHPNTYANSLDLQKLVVRTLGKFGSSASLAVPGLIVALDDPSLQVDAAQALRIILGSDVKGAALVKALKDSDQMDERQIALVLGAPTADAVPALMELLGHKKVRVRAAAALSLGRLGPKSKESEAVLIKALTDDNREVRLNAIGALYQQTTGQDKKGLTHAKALAAFEDTLTHCDEVTRIEAALRMAQVAVREPNPELLKTQLPAKVLLEALRHEANPARQQTLLDALKGLAAIRTDLHLVREMDDADILARERVALALGTITTGQDNDAGILKLGKALQDRHVALRRQAVKALSKLAEEEKVDLKAALKKETVVLESAVQERDRVVRQAAAIALWRITHQTERALPVLLEDHGDLSYDDHDLIEKLRTGKPSPPVLVELVSMAEADKKARDALVASLGHDNERVRAGAGVVIGSMKKPSGDVFAQSLVTALGDKSHTVRMQATVASRWLELNKAQEKQLIPVLERGLEDRATNVRLQTLLTLGKIGPRSGLVRLDHLQAALKDRDGSVRVAAVEALGQFGSKAEKSVVELQRAMKDQDGVVRRHATASLGQIGTAAIPALKSALTDKDFDIRLHGIVALGSMGPAAHDALPALRTALKDSDEEVAAAAAVALKQVEVGKNP